MFLQTENKSNNLNKVGNAYNKIPKLVCEASVKESKTIFAVITRLSKALQVLKLEGKEIKKQGKTVYVLQAELHSGRLNCSENILSIN